MTEPRECQHEYDFDGICRKCQRSEWLVDGQRKDRVISEQARIIADLRAELDSEKTQRLQWEQRTRMREAELAAANEARERAEAQLASFLANCETKQYYGYYCECASDEAALDAGGEGKWVSTPHGLLLIRGR